MKKLDIWVIENVILLLMAANVLGISVGYNSEV
jgi:hypothetical protein